MKYRKVNPFIAYAIDEASTSNDWLSRFENEYNKQVRKAKNQTKAKRDNRVAQA